MLHGQRFLQGETFNFTMGSPHWRNLPCLIFYPDAEGRIISEPQKDDGTTKTTKQGPADKTRNKTKAAGRSKRAGPAAEGGARQNTAAQVSSMWFVSRD